VVFLLRPTSRSSPVRPNPGDSSGTRPSSRRFRRQNGQLVSCSTPTDRPFREPSELVQAPILIIDAFPIFQRRPFKRPARVPAATNPDLPRGRPQKPTGSSRSHVPTLFAANKTEKAAGAGSGWKDRAVVPFHAFPPVFLRRRVVSKARNVTTYVRYFAQDLYAPPNLLAWAGVYPKTLFLLSATAGHQPAPATLTFFSPSRPKFKARPVGRPPHARTLLFPQRSGQTSQHRR